MHAIEFTIRGGKVTAKASGFKGNACESEIRKILSGLGKSEGSEHILPDYFEQEVDGTQSVEGSG